jgi:tryptophan synthase alpha chain
MQTNRITTVVQQARQDGRKLLIPYYTAGFPTPGHAVDIILSIADSGADILELGMPFSDPMADGPTIQHSCQAALQQGVTLLGILDMVREVRKQSEIPIILFGYFNPVYHYGIEQFMQDAHSAGADGVLLADLPVGEIDRVKPAAQQANIHLTCLAAPTCSDEQLRTVEQATDDFVYCVSIAGVTGARVSVYDVAKDFLQHAGTVFSKPYIVGFGIATPEDVRQISAVSDGVVVGSALMKHLQTHQGDAALPAKARQFVEALRAPLV